MHYGSYSHASPPAAYSSYSAASTYAGAQAYQLPHSAYGPRASDFGQYAPPPQPPQQLGEFEQLARDHYASQGAHAHDFPLASCSDLDRSRRLPSCFNFLAPAVASAEYRTSCTAFFAVRVALVGILRASSLTNALSATPRPAHPSEQLGVLAAAPRHPTVLLLVPFSSALELADDDLRYATAAPGPAFGFLASANFCPSAASAFDRQHLFFAATLRVATSDAAAADSAPTAFVRTAADLLPSATSSFASGSVNISSSGASRTVDRTIFLFSAAGAAAAANLTRPQSTASDQHRNSRLDDRSTDAHLVRLSAFAAAAT